MNKNHWSRSEIRARRFELEDRLEELRARRLKVADRLGLAAVAPDAVPVEEVEALRAERVRLSVEIDDLTDGLVVLRRMEAAVATINGPKGVRS